MKALAYDLFMLLGASLVVGGVAVIGGLGPALLTAGAFVLGLTVLAARR